MSPPWITLSTQPLKHNLRAGFNLPNHIWIGARIVLKTICYPMYNIKFLFSKSLDNIFCAACTICGVPYTDILGRYASAKVWGGFVSYLQAIKRNVKFPKISLVLEANQNKTTRANVSF